MTPEQIAKIIRDGNYFTLLLILGIAVVQFFVVYFFGEKIKKSIDNKYKTSLESYKNELLRRKVIYEQQLEAYKSFAAIMYEIYPEKYHPDMDWDEAVEQIVLGFKSYDKKIKDFLLNQSAILPQDIKEKMEHCWYLCSDGKFENQEFGISSEGHKMAEELWEDMKIIEKEFRKLLKIDVEQETLLINKVVFGGNMKKCFYCKKDIEDKAIKCPHCGEQIDKWRFWFRHIIHFLVFAVTIASLVFVGVQVKIASQQLKQSQLDSAIINRPYVEIRPVAFIVSDKRDPKDSTSVFCSLILELKNYSDIPATNVTLEDFKVGSVSRGYLTSQNYPISFKNICLFPQSSFQLSIPFVMNPDYHISKYDMGTENYNIHFKIDYEGIKGADNKTKHQYACDWIYSRKMFSIVRNDTDLVK